MTTEQILMNAIDAAMRALEEGRHDKAYTILREGKARVRNMKERL